MNYPNCHRNLLPQSAALNLHRLAQADGDLPPDTDHVESPLRWPGSIDPLNSCQLDQKQPEHLRRLHRPLTEKPLGNTGAHRNRLLSSLLGIGLFSVLLPQIGWSNEIPISPGTPPAMADDGLCSLMEAIINANNDAAVQVDCPAGQGADTLVLPPASTQELTAVHNRTYGVTGLPIIASDITIQGNGSSIVRNSSAPSFRLMAVTGTLTLRNITLQGGRQSDWEGDGVRNGGCAILIYEGSVDIENSTLADNSCFYRGGGIYNVDGHLKLTDSTVTGNTGSTGGGLAQLHGQAEISRVTFSGNTAAKNDGGAIYGGASILTISDSTVRDNNAFYGGGIRQEWDSQGTIRNCVISNNLARTSGGGVENGAFATMTIFNSTISGNVSNGLGGGLTGTTSHSGLVVVSTTISGNTSRTSGGGVSVWGEGLTTLTRSTVAFNHANTRGGGVYVSNSPTVLSNTIVTGNTTGGSGPEISCTGTLCGRYALVNHYNLLGHSGSAGLAGVSAGNRDVVPTQAPAQILDASLANNGGPTPTHALLPGSAAVDTGDPDYQKVIFGRDRIYDQRGEGFLRMRGANMDIGAFEVQP
ncbi:choice-of-anchor Q domain-containing protein [Methylolobus aquaticus]